MRAHLRAHGVLNGGSSAPEASEPTDEEKWLREAEAVTKQLADNWMITHKTEPSDNSILFMALGEECYNDPKSEKYCPLPRYADIFRKDGATLYFPLEKVRKFAHEFFGKKNIFYQPESYMDWLSFDENAQEYVYKTDELDFYGQGGGAICKDISSEFTSGDEIAVTFVLADKFSPQKNLGEFRASYKIISEGENSFLRLTETENLEYSRIESRVFSENGKFGLRDDSGKVIIPAEYESGRAYRHFAVLEDSSGRQVLYTAGGEKLGVFDGVDAEMEQSLAAAYTLDGEREYRLLDENGRPYMGKEPAKKYTGFYKDGSIINEVPLDNCVIEKSHTEDGKYWFSGAADGSYYWFTEDKNGFRLAETGSPSEEKTAFGYTLTRYFWDVHNGAWGIIAPDVTVISEPLYEKIDILFADRISLIYGGSAYMDYDFGKSILIDDRGKIICDSRYNGMFYSVYDDGSYVGAAYSFDDTTDANGALLPAGWYFVDKDGNPISGRWKHIDISSGGSGVGSKDGTLRVSFDDDSFGEVKIADYIIHP